MHRMRTRFAALALAAFAAGCSPTTNQIGSAAVDQEVELRDSFLLPGAGGPALVAVTQRGFSNGVEQTIALAGNSSVPGQNGARVRVFGALKGRIATQTAMPDEFIPLRTIDRDIRAAMPGVAMQKAPFYVQNRYGPFGYSVGRRGRDLCLYGWQVIKERPRAFASRGSIDVRVRVCETNASESRLLAFMYGYTLNVFVDADGWNPYGDPAGPDEGLGQPGGDIYPSSAGQVQTVLEPAAPPVQQPTRRVPVRAAPRAEPTPPPAAAPIGPAVPLPPRSAVTTPVSVPAPPPAN